MPVSLLWILSACPSSPLRRLLIPIADDAAQAELDELFSLTVEAPGSDDDRPASEVEEQPGHGQKRNAEGGPTLFWSGRLPCCLFAAVQVGVVLLNGSICWVL